MYECTVLKKKTEKRRESFDSKRTLASGERRARAARQQTQTPPEGCTATPEDRRVRAPPDARPPFPTITWGEDCGETGRRKHFNCVFNCISLPALLPARPSLAAAQTGSTRERKLRPKEQETGGRVQGQDGDVGNESQARFAPNGPFEVLRRPNQAST